MERLHIGATDFLELIRGHTLASELSAWDMELRKFTQDFILVYEWLEGSYPQVITQVSCIHIGP